MNWDEIDRRWGELLEIFRLRLPLGECIDFDNQGSVVTSNRPMAESIVAARMAKDGSRFQRYLIAASVTVTTRKVIHVGVGDRLRLGSGGSGHRDH